MKKYWFNAEVRQFNYQLKKYLEKLSERLEEAGFGQICHIVVNKEILQIVVQIFVHSPNKWERNSLNDLKVLAEVKAKDECLKHYTVQINPCRPKQLQAFQTNLQKTDTM